MPTPLIEKKSTLIAKRREEKTFYLLVGIGAKEKKRISPSEILKLC